MQYQLWNLEFFRNFILWSKLYPSPRLRMEFFIHGFYDYLRENWPLGIFWAATQITFFRRTASRIARKTHHPINCYSHHFRTKNSLPCTTILLPILLLVGKCNGDTVLAPIQRQGIGDHKRYGSISEYGWIQYEDELLRSKSKFKTFRT